MAIIFIPIIIILSIFVSKYRSESNRSAAALRKLFLEGRISAQEYHDATGRFVPGNPTYTWQGQNYVRSPQGQPSAAQNPEAQPPGREIAANPASMPAPAATMPSAPTDAASTPAPAMPSVPANADSTAAVPQNNPYRWHGPTAPGPAFSQATTPTSPAKPIPTPPKKAHDPKEKRARSVSAVGILLVLGVLFILAAGLIFATTTWKYLENSAKAIIISSLCVLFFGVSALSEYKLRLKQTGIAFYALGCAFLPITLLAIGWLRLFGDWFSLFGGGRFFLALTASLLLGTACALGAEHYRFRLFGWLTYVCASAAMLFAAWALIPSRGGSSFILSLLALFIALSADAAGKKVQDSKSLLLPLYPRYAPLHTLFCGAWTALMSGTGPFAFLCALVLSISFLQKSLRKSPLGSVLFSLFLLTSVLRIGEQSMDTLWLFMVLTLLPMTAISQTKLFEGTAGKVFGWMVRGLTLAVLMIGGISTTIYTFFSFGWEGIWTVPMLGATIVLLINLSWQMVVQRDQFLRLFHPLVLLLVFSGTTQLFLNGWGFALLCTIAYFVYRFVSVSGEKIRSAASDSLMAAGCFVSGCGFLVDSQLIQHSPLSDTLSFHPYSAAANALAAFILLCIILLGAAILWDGGTTDRIFTAILPFAMGGLVVSLQMLFPMAVPKEIFFQVYCLILTAVGGLGLLVEKPLCKRLVWPFGIALNLNAVFCISGSLLGSLSPLPLWLTAIWWGMVLFSLLREKSDVAQKVWAISFSVWTCGGFLMLAGIFTSLYLLPAGEMMLHLCAPSAIIVGLFVCWMLLREHQPAHLVIRPLSLLVSGTFLLLHLICSLLYFYDFRDSSALMAALLPLALGAFAFASLRLCGLDWLNFLPVATFPLLMKLTVENTFTLTSLQEFWIGMVLLLFFFLLSRTLYPAFFGRSPRSIDWFWALGWLIIPIFCFLEPSFTWLLLALYTAGFVRRIPGQFTDRSILTLSLAFLCVAWWTRPGLYPPAWLYLESQLLAPIAALLILRYLIWKNVAEKAHYILLGGFLLCGLALGFDAVFSNQIKDFILLNVIGFSFLSVDYFTRKPLFGWVLGWIGPAALILTADPYRSFWGFLLLAIYTLGFLGYLEKPWGNSIALTGTLCCLCGMWWVQPYLVVPLLLATELDLLPLVLLASAMRFWLWKELKWSPILLFLVSSGSILLLAGEALLYRRSGDAIILGVTTLSMLLLAFWIRSKRWFLLSGLTLLGVLLYLTRSFWISLAWWIYLLAAGILLITFAAANELCRQRGTNLPKRLGRLMEDWKW